MLEELREKKKGKLNDWYTAKDIFQQVFSVKSLLFSIKKGEKNLSIGKIETFTFLD